MAVEGEPIRLPIFELPVALLPGELMPLHIFEERYKRMIDDCLTNEEPFGIVFRDEDGSARRVGCSARVTEVVERFDDGRLNVVVTGELPFRVLDRFEEPDYPAGEIEPIDPAGDEPAGDQAAVDDARKVFAELVERIAGDDAEADEAVDGDAYAIAARVELPADVKQRLLELRSEQERLKILRGALRDMLGILRRSHEIAERARFNGKVTLA